MKSFVIKTVLACAAAFVLAVPQRTLAAETNIFDDFNVNEGHFNQAPSFSGSTVGILANSTADRVTVGGPVEGTGYERLVLNTNGLASIRVRFLSGGGTIANNTPFTTSAGTDGWIGCYVRTTNTGWNVQIWIENASNNGSIPKNVTPDGQWHLYEWNLDDTTGGADGWGSIAGIIAGVATVADGSHSIDSVLFRNTAAEQQTNVLELDFVARNGASTVADLLVNPCLNTSGVLVNGPLSTNSNLVNVTGVAATATNLTVYQDSGAGMVVIGTKTTGVTAGNNNVTVSGLVKGAIVSATQTINGQEGCVPTVGVTVGGGANPPLRMTVTVRETANTTATVGAPGNIASSVFHFLGTTTVSGGAPIDAPIIYPSNTWQTVTFDRGTIILGNAANATGAAVDTGGYNANDSVAIRVYAYALTNSVTIYSRVAAQSAPVTSNDVFAVNWTWNAVPGADGYRLLRDLNGAGYVEFQDVAAAATLSDANNGWQAGDTVTPSVTQTNVSIQWFPTVGNPNNVGGQWGCLESINFAIADTTDTGPHDLYIDNIKNGSTVFQTFEEAVAGTVDYGFRIPSFSGTTSGGILTSPDVGQVSNQAADTGTKSFRVNYQWNGTNATKWLRLTTSGVLPASNPFVNLDEPISFRVLFQPVGATPVAPPARPTLTITPSGGNTVLSWTGAHQLQAAPDVTGTYTNIPGATISPYTDTGTGTNATRFFRLVN